MNKKGKIGIMIGIILLVLIGVIGITFAFFSTGGSQEQANTFTSGCLNISLTDASASIYLTNTYPIPDVEGLDGTSYDFTITNTCTTSTNYQINLESLNEVANTLSADYIKVALSSDTVDNVISILSDNTSVIPEIDGAYESYNLYTGTLGASEAKTYHLKLWLDYDATVEEAANKVYQSKINVIANPETQVVDNLEATFELNDKTLTSNLTSNVTSATYCTTTDNICTPNTTASISNNNYTVDLETNEKNQMACTRLNGTSKIICSNPLKVQQTLLKDEILANNEVNSGTPDFSQVAIADEGMYKAEDNLGTSYYFRGAVTNNYVQFAGYYWRIIRINGDGSIRIIYDGTSVHANGESSTDRQTGTNAYNSTYNQSYYVGYTYTENMQKPSAQNGGTASTIKGVLDNWYATNISGKGLDDRVVSTPGFCNDREVASGDSWVSSGSTIRYAPYERVVTNKAPTLKCSNTNDIYTTKVGLITVDEVMFAGGTTSNNNSYYLYTGQVYWTMSSHGFYVGSSNSWARVFVVWSSGNFSYLAYGNVNNAFGVRPVLNLSADVTISAGNGTMDNPYIIA